MKEAVGPCHVHVMQGNYLVEKINIAVKKTCFQANPYNNEISIEYDNAGRAGPRLLSALKQGERSGWAI
jgi:hypothetical protein